MHSKTLPTINVNRKSRDNNYTISLSPDMRSFFQRRIFPGFRIGEAALWFLFHISWPLMLLGIFHVSGKFEDKNFMTMRGFLEIQAFVVMGKAIFLLPFWWLFFVRLKKTPLKRKLPFHLITASIYTAACLATFYWVLTGVLDREYSWNSMLADIYNLLLSYFSHFALFHAYNFWLHTRQQLKKEQELRELAYQSEIMALKAQIEPHFLFNTLNSISASVPVELEKTRVLIAQLADTFRYGLSVSERQTVTLEEELNFVKTWLALEKHRFGNRLTIVYDIDPTALSAHIPSLMLQPLLENAIKHGISPNIQGGTVTVKCKRIKNYVQVSVSDTGVGFTGDLESMFQKGVGLRNSSKRLEHLYNEKLEVERNENGLTFSFQIPFV